MAKKLFKVEVLREVSYRHIVTVRAEDEEEATESAYNLDTVGPLDGGTLLDVKRSTRILQLASTQGDRR